MIHQISCSYHTLGVKPAYRIRRGINGVLCVATDGYLDDWIQWWNQILWWCGIVMIMPVPVREHQQLPTTSYQNLPIEVLRKKSCKLCMLSGMLSNLQLSKLFRTIQHISKINFPLSESTAENKKLPQWFMVWSGAFEKGEHCWFFFNFQLHNTKSKVLNSFVWQD